MIKEVVPPTKGENGITFYISSNGKRTGVSQRGLARLCGLGDRANIFEPYQNKMLHLLSNGTLDCESCPECLRPFIGKVYEWAVEGTDGAKVVSQDAAVAIIEYYAFEKSNDVARESYRKFSAKGFNAWVKEITGYASSEQSAQLLETVQEVLIEVKGLKSQVAEYNRLKGITTTIYPGLNNINTNLSFEGNEKLLESKDLYTASDWLSLKGIILTKSEKYKFAMIASDTYLTFTASRLQLKYKQRVNKNGSVKWIKDGNGYRLVDFHILEAAYQSMLLNQQKQSKN